MVEITEVLLENSEAEQDPIEDIEFRNSCKLHLT